MFNFFVTRGKLDIKNFIIHNAYFVTIHFLTSDKVINISNCHYFIILSTIRALFESFLSNISYTQLYITNLRTYFKWQGTNNASTLVNNKLLYFSIIKT